MFVQVLSQGRVALRHEITTFLELPRFTFEPPSSLHCCTVSHDLRKVACSLWRLWRRSPLRSRAFSIFASEHYHSSFCFRLSSPHSISTILVAIDLYMVLFASWNDRLV
jgi:hypothetical protein